MERILERAAGIIWGALMIALILFCGIYLTVRLRGVQLRGLGRAVKYALKEETGGKGEVSAFGALCTSLAATIGTGNIVGVATAIAAGGPGALFWMIVSAAAGMATKYAEGLLAVKYRRIGNDGHVLGGPFYYIEDGMGKRWKRMGKLFALFGAAAGLFGIGTITQVSGIASAAERFFDPMQEHILFSLGGKGMTAAAVLSGGLAAILAGCVLLGGVQRIARVSETVIPFVGAVFVVFNILAILLNIRRLPAAVMRILRGAFGWDAALGGMLGAMQKGIARGIFSNEAGLGTAPIAAAAARTKDPVRQGLVTMLGTFIDTVVMCTLTGLVIVIAGTWEPQYAAEGVGITLAAFQRLLPIAPRVTAFVLMFCLTVFAFTTIIGWNYYAERCYEYLSSGRGMSAYRCAYIAAVFIGPYIAVDAVWMAADIMNGMMAVPNIIALLALSGAAAKLTEKDFGCLRKTKKDR